MKNIHADVLQKDDRLFLDIVKGIAVFFMLWGHCIQYCANKSFDFYENGLFKFIYSFHMPLFMMLSGYLFYFSCRKRNLSELLIHRAQSLLQPIIMCSILNYYLTVVLSQRTLSSIVDGPWIGTLSALWFLWSVLTASLAVGIASKVTKKPVVHILLMILGFFAVYFFPNSTYNLFMYPYFVAGFIYAKYKDRIPKAVSCFKYVLCIVFPIMLAFFKKDYYIYTTGIIPSGSVVDQLWIDGYRWVIGFAGSIFILVILKLLYAFLFKKKPAIVKPVAKLGIKSLQVYCISFSLLSYWLPRIYGKICDMLGRNIFASNMLIYNYVFTPIVSIVYAALIYYFIFLLEKIKVSRVIFGR